MAAETDREDCSGPQTGDRPRPFSTVAAGRFQEQSRQFALNRIDAWDCCRTGCSNGQLLPLLTRNYGGETAGGNCQLVSELRLQGTLITYR